MFYVIQLNVQENLFNDVITLKSLIPQLGAPANTLKWNTNNCANYEIIRNYDWRFR